MPSETPTTALPVYDLAAGDHDAGALHVLSFEGQEQMSDLYRFEVVIWCKETDENALETSLIGKPAVLTMHLAAGASRCVRGIVSAVALEGKRESGRHAFRLTIVPGAWLLTRRTNSRIFQDRTVQQIVEAILDEHGLARDFNLLARYPNRQYCLQYQESDYAFVTRILAEEGIFFWFEQPSEGGVETSERLCFGDSAHAYPALGGDPALVFREQRGDGAMHAEENHVIELRAETRIEPNTVTMRDYDFRRPLLDLTSTVKSAADAPDAGAGRTLEVYDHHGEYEETDADAGNAGVFLEQLRAGVREAAGRSMCRRLMPGHRFDLSDHEVERLNASWVVTRVEHRGISAEAAGGQARTYENRFRCAPAEVPFRPPRPPRVLRQVTETAVVVGPEGQEIFTDAYGRVKVQFPWDREGKRNAYSSCWMRVVHAWAGSGWGAQFIPRIGMEVLVSFLGGDQDRPVVVGCLYNAQNPPAYGLPGQVTRSGIRSNSTPGGGGSNEIAFDDRAGSEQLYVHAERNLDEEVGNDRSTLVRHNRVETVEGEDRSIVGGARSEETGGDRSDKVGGTRAAVVGGAETLRVSGQRSADVGGSDALHVAGDLDVSAGGSRKTQIEKSDRLLVMGDHNVVVYGGEARTVWEDARTIVYGGASTTVAGRISLSVGTSTAPKAAEGQISGDITLKGGGTIDLAADKTIRLRVGKSTITIGPDEVKIEADKITFAAKSIEGKSDKSSLSMGEAVELSGKTVKVFSEDKAILELDKEAKIDGQAVKLKPGLAAEAQKTEEREEQAKDLPKVKIHLFDRRGKLIPNALYEVTFFGYHDEGTAPDGTVEVPAFPDVETAHVRWGRPNDQRDNPKDPEKYEFEMDVFMVVDHDDEDESLQRKLHNLGHQGSALHEAVNKLQAALGVERTGVADDIKDEVASRHDGVSPVEIEAKGA
ncbi:MAG: type VI secretion system tip protein TssI/VgrG [Byssovorax sp.]